MSRVLTRRTPKPRYYPGSTIARTKAEWDQLCEYTAHRILRGGFLVEYLHPEYSVQLGAELKTGVVLVVAARDKPVKWIEHTDAGITEGLKDLARNGLDGEMRLYGLDFYFVPAT
ncbi:hypothetical protein F5Y08DRAFT_320356 [Xylaria arbuscula]|nr:hypothetical protein F5Y08DRAFT_320356 [Xylaria arbuscula]